MGARLRGGRTSARTCHWRRQPDSGVTAIPNLDLPASNLTDVTPSVKGDWGCLELLTGLVTDEGYSSKLQRMLFNSMETVDAWDRQLLKVMLCPTNCYIH
jgi:hypothetical protein